MKKVAIVGAGPAGIAAATELAGKPGLEVCLIDEASRPGGQIFRHPQPHVDTDMGKVLGRAYDKFERFHAQSVMVTGKVDYRPQTLVWNVFEQHLHTVSKGKLDEVPYDFLIIATGATDRILPVKGWTLPGVYTLGGAQILLKEQGCLIGRRVVFCGSSPLLYLAALQYARSGGEVAAVLDTTPLAAKIGAAPQLLAKPGILAEGLYHIAQLRLMSVDIHGGVRLEAFEGAGAVSAVRYTGRGSENLVACDAVAFGFGLRPETQLAELAGCSLDYDPLRRQWYPSHDPDGRCGGGVYVAGDGAQMGGADAAALSGKLAAWALLTDTGIESRPNGKCRAASQELDRLLTFQRGLSQAFAWPATEAARLADTTILCRCENVSVGEVRTALRMTGGPSETNRVKSVTRCGMGRCQGRFCEAGLAEIVASEGPVKGEGTERLRAQPPIKPLALSTVQGLPLE